MALNDYTKGFAPGASHWHRQDAERMATQVRTDATYTGGVMRWKSNNAVPPKECVEAARYHGLPVDVAKCDAARDEDLQKFLKAYRAARKDGPTDEERFEARAAHGPGVELVDVFTGHKWRT